LLNALGLAVASTAAAAAFLFIPWRSNYSPFLISYIVAALALAISQSASVHTAGFKARWFLATLLSGVLGLVVASAILSLPLIWLVLSTARGPLPPVASVLAIAAFGAAGGLISGIILSCGQLLAPAPRYAWTRSWVVPCTLSFGLGSLIFAVLYTASLFLLPPTIPEPLAMLVPAPLAAFASGATVGAITRTRLEFIGPTTEVQPNAPF
jgi:hypothetical protein